MAYTFGSLKVTVLAVLTTPSQFETYWANPLGYVYGADVVPGASDVTVTVGQTFNSLEDFEAAIYLSKSSGADSGADFNFTAGGYTSGDPVLWGASYSTGAMQSALQTIMTGLSYSLEQALAYLDAIQQTYGLLPASYNGYALSTPVQDIKDSSAVDTSQVVVVTAGDDYSVSAPVVIFSVEATPDYSFTFGDFTNSDFVDWKTADSIGANYSSYINTFFHMPEPNDPSGRGEDHTLWMQAPYIYTYTDNSGASDRSLLLQGAWDWANVAGSSNKFTRSTQVYKFKSGYSATVSRTKLRGRGRSLQLRFTSEAGKDFKLYGWSVWYGKNGRP